LPRTNPRTPGLKVAGKSIYCDETGGDYYDFIEFKQNDTDKLGVVVGDVAGHGISSALLMATVRSALRQRLSLPGSISQVITDVNQQLAEDLEDSGQFVTLFYLTIDPVMQLLEWVRAGHDPAIFYDPTVNEFLELDGKGMALGIDKNWHYEQNRKVNFNRGSIILLGTDGVWEARNDKGQMFGRKSICNVLRSHANADPGDIIDAIIEQIKNFRKTNAPEDDLTLVIIKLL
jgi:sigma-B regulation protein RsbU (phosphoserine phosphatase)